MTTRERVSGEASWPFVETAKINATSIDRSNKYLLIRSLHLEIAQRHSLVELVVLDVKFDVVIAGLWNIQFRHVDACHFSDAARGLDGRFGGSFWPDRQGDLSFFYGGPVR